MNTQIKKSLEKTGLNKPQINVYLELFKQGESTAGKIAYSTNIKRTSVYLILKQLTEKGLVSQYKKNAVIVFKATAPSYILEAEQEKLIALEAALPELKNLQGIHKSLPEMTIFEGVKQVIDMCEDTLDCSTELLSWVDISNITGDPIINEYSLEYWKKRVDRKIPSRGVWSYDKKALEYKKAAKHENRELVLIPKKAYPFKNEIFVYDDKVAILSSDDHVGIIIKNQAIADTHRALFELSFHCGKEQEKKLLTKKDLEYLEG